MSVCMGRKLKQFVVGGVALIALGVSSVLQAEALVSPVRLFLDENTTRAVAILNNPSKGERTYRLGWVENKMDEGGTQTPYGPDGIVQHATASQFLRYSPRQIVVPPGGSQTVRIDFRPPKNMSPGEYRSHLNFQVVPEVSEPHSMSKIGSDSEGISVVLAMQLSISIPVILRYQVTDAPQVTIGEVVRLPVETGAQPRMAITLERAGQASSYGAIVVEMQRNANSPVELIGEVSGINIYADAERRRVDVPLRDSGVPSGAWIRVAYVGLEEYQGHVFAEKVMQLP